MDVQFFVVISVIAFTGVLIATAVFRLAGAFTPTFRFCGECGWLAAEQKSN